MAKVTTIPATISRFTATPINEKKKRRVAAYTQRCNHQNPVNLEAVKQQVIDGGKGDARFAEAHVQKDGGNGMRFDIVDGISLIVMRCVSHQGYNRMDNPFPRLIFVT